MFHVTDRPNDNVTTVSTHVHEDGHTTRQLLCQWCSGPFHAKRAENAASVHRYHLSM